MQNYHIVTFGCQMNVHESEKIAGIFEYLNYQAVDDIEKADAIILNTCCIRENAENKAKGKIGSIKKLKKSNPNLLVIVLGCMTQQPGVAEKLKKTYPYIDIILGTSSIDKLLDLVPEISKSKKSKIYIDDNDKPEIVENELFHRTSAPHAWVNIAYGCNNFCTYCIVPYVRGRERSRQMQDIIDECKQLIKNGYKEITLLGQNVNSYGNDLNSNESFPKLLQEIANIDGKFRIRFMTSHPKDLSDELIETIANNEKISKLIHLPIQAGSNIVLKNMNRHYTTEYYLDVVKKIREKIPNCSLTTDIMVGFPYETDEDFNETIDVVKKVRYQSAFTFIYSPRSGTKAATMKQISDEVKSKRIQTLIDVQNQISDEIANSYVGSVFEVLFEEKNNDIISGRADNGMLVHVKDNSDEYIGQFVKVKINNNKRTALYGTIIK